MTGRLAMTVCLALALLVPAANASAEDGFELNRRGFYLQANGFFAFENYDDDLKSITAGFVSAKNGSGLNVRGGYQVLSWLAVEALYEFETNDGNIGTAKNAFELKSHNMIANLKLSLPFWRVQPYIGLGIGAQRAKIDSKIVNPWIADDRQWNFVGRPAIGIDLVLIEHWSINVEAAGALALNDYKSRLGQSLDRLFYTSLGGGIRYRF